MTMTIEVLLSMAVVLLAVIAVLLYRVLRSQNQNQTGATQSEVIWSRGGVMGEPSLSRRRFIPTAIAGMLALFFFESAAKNSLTAKLNSAPPQHGDSNPSEQHGDSNPSEQHGDSNSRVASNKLGEQHGDSNV
jgi:hypothetical protein